MPTHDKIKLSCNIFTLENSAKEKLIEKANLQNRILETAFVTIVPWKIESIKALVESEIHRQELITAYKNNVDMPSKRSQLIYEFYTDGSMYNRGQQEITMGAAWI